MTDVAVSMNFLTSITSLLPDDDVDSSVSDPTLVTLPSGDRVVFYAYETPTEFFPETNLYLQHLPATGPIPDPVLVDQANAGRWVQLYSELTLMARDDGSIVLAWRHYQRGSGEEEDTFNFQVIAADGTPGPIHSTAIGDGEHRFYPQLLDNGTDGFSLLWAGWPLEQTDAWVQHFTADGSPLTDPVQLFHTTDPEGDGRVEIHDMERLSDGGWAVIWSDMDRSVTIPPYDQVQADTVMMQIINADGTARSGIIPISAENATDYGRSRLVPVADGGVIAIWEDGFHFTQQQTLAQRYDANGTPVGDSYALTAPLYLYDAFALSGDRFGVVHVMGDDLLLQQFTTDGTALTTPEVIWRDMGDWRFTAVLRLEGDVLSIIHDDQTRQVDVSAVPLLGDGDDAHTLTEAGRLNGWIGDDSLTGSAGNDALLGHDGQDRLIGGDIGDDVLIGGLGRDVVNGGAGNDLLYGDDSLLFTASHREDYYPTTPDLSDTILGGDGHDTIIGGDGNDLAYGGTGDDILNGGRGGDTLIGQAGQDSLSGGALGDMLFGGDGDDYLNGGVGYDRLNGGAGADRFYHQGNWDHGSDWIQDYTAADGDVLQLGAIVTSDQFQVNFARTPGAGDADTDEAFVIYRPTGQIMWALVDGAAQDSMTLQIGAQTFDLLI